MLHSILDCVVPGDSLNTVNVWLSSSEFYTDRSGMLDLLCGEVVEGIQRFPMLQRLSINFTENDPKFDNLWWNQQLARRRLSDVIQSTISIRVRYSIDRMYSPAMRTVYRMA